jgi:hypothetical protein
MGSAYSRINFARTPVLLRLRLPAQRRAATVEPRRVTKHPGALAPTTAIACSAPLSANGHVRRAPCRGFSLSVKCVRGRGASRHPSLCVGKLGRQGGKEVPQPTSKEGSNQGWGAPLCAEGVSTQRWRKRMFMMPFLPVAQEWEGPGPQRPAHSAGSFDRARRCISAEPPSRGRSQSW